MTVTTTLNAFVRVLVDLAERVLVDLAEVFGRQLRCSCCWRWRRRVSGKSPPTAPEVSTVAAYQAQTLQSTRH